MNIGGIISRVGIRLGVAGVDGVKVTNTTLEARGETFEFFDRSTAKTPRVEVLGKVYAVRYVDDVASKIAVDLHIELAKRQIAKDRKAALEVLKSLAARLNVGMPPGLTCSVVGTELAVKFSVPDLKLTARALKALKQLMELDALAKEQNRTVHGESSTLLPEPVPVVP